MSDCIWPVASSRTVAREDGVCAPEGPMGDAIMASARGASLGFATYVRTCGRSGGRSGLCHFHEGPAIDAVQALIQANQIGPEQLEPLIRTILSHRWAPDLVREVIGEDVQSRLKAVWGAA